MTAQCRRRRASACAGARGPGRCEDGLFRGLDCLSLDCRNSVVDCGLIRYWRGDVFANVPKHAGLPVAGRCRVVAPRPRGPHPWVACDRALRVRGPRRVIVGRAGRI